MSNPPAPTTAWQKEVADIAGDLDFAVDVTEPREVILKRFADIIAPYRLKVRQQAVRETIESLAEKGWLEPDEAAGILATLPADTPATALVARLRALAIEAEKRSPSPWSVSPDSSLGNDGVSYATGFARVFDDTKGPDYREICDYIDIETCEFVAACDPQTILRLCDALTAHAGETRPTVAEPWLDRDCPVCRRVVHAAWHRFAQCEINPIALLHFIQTTPCSPDAGPRIERYVRAVTGITASPLPTDEPAPPASRTGGDGR
jgi:hypothetical protein